MLTCIAQNYPNGSRYILTKYNYYIYIYSNSTKKKKTVLYHRVYMVWLYTMTLDKKLIKNDLYDKRGWTDPVKADSKL